MNDPLNPAQNRLNQLDGKVVTKVQTLEMMYLEAKNELVKNKIMDRMLQRLNLSKPSPQTTQAMAQNQSRIRMVEDTIKNLADMHSFEFAEELKKSNTVGENLVEIKPTQNATPV